jgi:signal transduction histidine kinase
MILWLRPWAWPVWDLVIATVVGTVAVQYRTDSMGHVLIGGLMAIALVARRHRPVATFAAVSVLALLHILFGPAVLAGYDIAVLIAMVAVVTHARSLRWAYLAGAVVALGVVLVVVETVVVRRTGSVLDLTYLGEYSALLAACMALWLIAYVLRSNRERSAVLAERAATAERERDHLSRLAAADERAFIARELHDVVAHSLAVMIAQADGASYVVDQDTAGAGAAMRTVAATGREALEDMHRIVAVLRGPGAAAESRPDRRRPGLDQLESLVERARTAGLAVELEIAGDPRVLTAAQELTVHRIVQESLTNTLRHAGPGARVTVGLRVGAAAALLEVDDDGGDRRTGPADGTERHGGGNGLVGMRERIAVHSGEFSAGSRPGSGWRVRATIPIKEAP